MPVPISSRLRLCAEMIPPGASVADVGADHGYLCIWLLDRGLARYACACDLRAGPLDSARRNAEKYRLADRMDFYLSDGLDNVPRDRVDTVVLAGMGGDLIAQILSRAPWLCDPCYTLILQPQTGIDDLRVWLNGQGFAEDRAELVLDAGRIYCVLRVRFGTAEKLTPGQCFVSDALRASGSPLLGRYIARTIRTLRVIEAGLEKAGANPDPVRLDYCRSAIAELREMEKEYADSQ